MCSKGPGSLFSSLCFRLCNASFYPRPHCFDKKAKSCLDLTLSLPIFSSASSRLFLILMNREPHGSERAMTLVTA